MGEESSIRRAMELLSSHAKLDRDNGAVVLKQHLEHLKSKESLIHGKDFEIEAFESSIISFLVNSTVNAPWEAVFAHLQASSLLLETALYSEKFADDVLQRGLALLEHTEFRVRIAAGEVLGALCKYKSAKIFKDCEGKLLQSITDNLERHIPSDPADKLLITMQGGTDSFGDLPSDVMAAKAEAHRRDAQEIFHDTAGWKCLETSMKGLQAVIEGCGEQFRDYLTSNMLDLLFETLKHTNRFVRETGFYVCAAVARFGVTSKDHEHVNKPVADSLALHLRKGLSDNWSQVRLAASVATRQFFLGISANDRESFYAWLLPPMCLNRYYLAEGVRIYNIETWRLVFGTEGRVFVAKYINETVAFYVDQTKSDNHAVREAACHCMAELGVKINNDAVRPHVLTILDTLHICFKDQSWPVRDTACVACGNFILVFPNEARGLLDELFPLFYTNLCDPIPSVRQGAAQALTNVARAYPEEYLSVIFDKTEEGLRKVEAQVPTIDRFEGFDKGPATYGVVKRLRDNDPGLHSNQQMYSCGSLAPKMHRGGGCSDHSFRRDSEPWEMSDGCIYLLAEMSAFPKAHERVAKCLPFLVQASKHRHYIQHVHLLETLCRQLPIIANGIGKRFFKPHLDTFFDPVFDALNCDSVLTKSAAAECLEALSKFIGPNILQGRLEQHNPKYLQQLADVLRGAI